MSKKFEDLKIKIFADGADKASISEFFQKPFIKGFTTNPTLIRKAGVTDYQIFAKELLNLIKDKPISFEVLSDEFPEMERQARLVASWGDNVYIKIPITNTKGESSFDLIKKLSEAGIKVNCTALLDLDQVKEIAPAFSKNTPGIISIFAGRIADTGRDPKPIMKEAKEYLNKFKNIELLWASSRELLNIFQAEEANCDIITVTPAILKKIERIDEDLKKFSLETVKMFYNDAQKASYQL